MHMLFLISHFIFFPLVACNVSSLPPSGALSCRFSLV